MLAPRWARKGLGPDKEPSGSATSGVSNDWEETSAAYSPITLKSLDLVDENLLNYDLLEALVVHVVETQSRYGPGALLQVSSAAWGIFLRCELQQLSCHVKLSDLCHAVSNSRGETQEAPLNVPLVPTLYHLAHCIL